MFNNAGVGAGGLIWEHSVQDWEWVLGVMILTSRLRVEGFIVSEHMEVWPEALKELGTLVATGRLKYRESIAQGLESAPEAFIGLLKGRNFGKQLVRLI